jgi:hypothetical protein
MPDIQTEMQKILQAWEQPETIEETKDTTMFKPTTNTSRATFDEVLNMPGLPPKEYIRRLDAKGHKPASTSSLLGQMIRQGILRKDSIGQLYTVGREYQPLKASKKLPKQPTKAKKVLTVKTSKPVEASAPVTQSLGLAALATPVREDRVQEIMNSISLPEAKRLYNSLATYFGSP